MLSSDDRRAIEGLFARLRDVERRTPPRDPEAEALIRESIARQPGASYYMAQTVLVQEHALEVAERRIRELENELRTGRRGADERYRIGAEDHGRPRGPWDRDERYERGGGFLAGAAQTALGVTGGILLGNTIAGMFGADAATAAEPAPEPEPGDSEDFDGGSGFDGDGFDGGGFDFGGDF